MILALLAGCAGEPGTTSACLAPAKDEASVVPIHLKGAPGLLEADLRFPNSRGRPLPVVVQVFGGWDDELPVEEIGPHDALELRFALAGSSWASGEADVRGPIARSAVAAALAYAHGDTEDDDGCRLTDRVPDAEPSTLILLGLSNGGNLAMATLADATLSLPEPIAVILWETPVGPQLINIEHRNASELYTPGSCNLDGSGLHCPFASAGQLNAEGMLCFDTDGDGGCSEDEAAHTPRSDPATGRLVTSPELLAAAGALGPLPDAWDTAAESATFWAERDALLAVPAVLARFPNLAFLLLASETDHILTGLHDHPHVYALGQTLQDADARWVRVNPGTRWTGQTEENAVGLPLRLGSTAAWLYSEVAEEPLAGPIGAAVNELSTRHRTADWVTEW
ncbi:MAG: hypothetical protein EXR71_08685 [Myxococcales bacterium]|nr:hypothetical protein [Myxococcales bacterium]